MRIPVGSCPACLKNQKLYPAGRHVDKNGQWFMCPFVVAELKDIPGVELISVHTSRRAAVRASGGYGPIQWVGQSPREMWLALRDTQTV